MDRPLASAPTKNAASAKRVTLRAENHLSKRPEKGKTMPMASMYPTTSHCTADSSTPKAPESWGKATLSAVSLYMPVNPPRYRPIMAR